MCISTFTQIMFLYVLSGGQELVGMIQAYKKPFQYNFKKAIFLIIKPRPH